MRESPPPHTHLVLLSNILTGYSTTLHAIERTSIYTCLFPLSNNIKKKTPLIQQDGDHC